MLPYLSLKKRLTILRLINHSTFDNDDSTWTYICTHALKTHIVYYGAGVARMACSCGQYVIVDTS